ncbi:hypothetical protein BC938DRAFT_470695 [Jimgerdemannia flammicorona]|uniref:Uncharacterized protein n=1 Tax=Jimgerdemannia flammicorona TaxID=994334 RepID=A0A433Q9N1_9FUNG|nr:hypothetical protein BC938DRAFT_470695 [Jimgerdemannia flammicorona]
MSTPTSISISTSTSTSNPTPTTTLPTQPPDSPAKTAYTSFRPYLRNFVKSRLPPPDSPRGPAPPNSWDEVCLRWYSQRRLDREEGEPPRCKMVCLRRKVAGAGRKVRERRSAVGGIRWVGIICT